MNMRRVSAIGNTRRQKKCNHSVDTLETQRVPALQDFFVNCEHAVVFLFLPSRGPAARAPRWVTKLPPLDLRSASSVHYFALHCTNFEESLSFPLYSWCSPPLERGQEGCIPAAAIAIPSRNRNAESSTAKFGNSAHSSTAQGRCACEWLRTFSLSIYAPVFGIGHFSIAVSISVKRRKFNQYK